MLATLALCLLLGWAELYRALQYVNVLFLLYLFTQQRIPNRQLWILWLAPVFALSILHSLATQEPALAKPIRHFWIASTIAVSICAMNHRNLVSAHSLIPILIFAFTVTYLALQWAFLIYLQKPFAATENPHYLAYFCGLLSLLNIYQAIRLPPEKTLWRAGHLGMTALLLLLIAASESGPTAMALSTAALVFGVLVSKGFVPTRVLPISALMVTGACLVAYFGVNTFVDGSLAILTAVQEDQRWGIWQDAWRMQAQATPLQWAIGHGAQSFVYDFTEFSRYHGIADFHSPHNSILEVLYAFGVIGVCAFIGGYFLIVGALAKGLRSELRPVALLIATVITYNYVLISLTMPLSTHFNLYTLAYCCGALFLINKKGHILMAVNPGSEHSNARR